MKAVVLAAGRGERLKPYTNYLPKPLINLRGAPLLRHIVSALTRAGLDEVLVITGYRNDILSRRIYNWREFEGVVRHRFNPDWHIGNATSLLAARKEVEEEDAFVLSMSDHIFDSSLVEKALNDFNGENTVCVDRDPKQLMDVVESTKVRLDDRSRVTQIGKGLEKWDAVDTGVFILRGDVFKMIPRGATQVSSCMSALASSMLLYGYDVSGIPWLDIDTPEDLEHARKTVHWV